MYQEEVDEECGSSDEEELFEKIQLQKEIIANVRNQPWAMSKKRQMLSLAKTYVEKHEGQLSRGHGYQQKGAQVLRRLKRELGNLQTIFIPWEMRIKQIESHFGSVVASYFVFLRWLIWINVWLTIIPVCFVMLPEALVGADHGVGIRKSTPPHKYDERANLKTIWDAEGIVKHSLMFYGYYGKNKSIGSGYRLPLAYFLTGMISLAFSFVVILKKMAANSRLNRASSKDEQFNFAWKLFTSWDFMIGNPETSNNKLASIKIAFKESILEEEEKMKEGNKYLTYFLRFVANFLVVVMLGSSTYAITLLVERSKIIEEKKFKQNYEATFWEENELTIVMTFISTIFPNIVDLLSLMEKYHPRTALRWQLARIFVMNLINLYTLFIALYQKQQYMRELSGIKVINTTCTNETIRITPNVGITPMPVNDIASDTSGELHLSTVLPDFNNVTSTMDIITQSAPSVSFVNICRFINKTSRERLCWETMIGQEMVKLTILDLVFVIGQIILIDFFRGLFVKYLNILCCWDLETKFPEYPEFKTAENILHLVNNQGMIWLGSFFAPGLSPLNMVKMLVLVYMRCWACLVCNVPEDRIFRASRSNNFYYTLLLIMLFLCTLPVIFAVMTIEPSPDCGPFSGYDKISDIIVVTMDEVINATVMKILKTYIVSPAVIIPIFMLLALGIYYLLSANKSKNEINKDLKMQLEYERTEGRKKIYAMAGAKKELDEIGGDLDQTTALSKKMSSGKPNGKVSMASAVSSVMAASRMAKLLAIEHSNKNPATENHSTMIGGPDNQTQSSNISRPKLVDVGKQIIRKRQQKKDDSDSESSGGSLKHREHRYDKSRKEDSNKKHYKNQDRQIERDIIAALKFSLGKKRHGRDGDQKSERDKTAEERAAQFIQENFRKKLFRASRVDSNDSSPKSEIRNEEYDLANRLTNEEKAAKFIQASFRRKKSSKIENVVKSSQNLSGKKEVLKEQHGHSKHLSNSRSKPLNTHNGDIKDRTVTKKNESIMKKNQFLSIDSYSFDTEDESGSEDEDDEDVDFDSKDEEYSSFDINEVSVGGPGNDGQIIPQIFITDHSDDIANIIQSNKENVVRNPLVISAGDSAFHDNSASTNDNNSSCLESNNICKYSNELEMQKQGKDVYNGQIEHFDNKLRDENISSTIDRVVNHDSNKINKGSDETRSEMNNQPSFSGYTDIDINMSHIGYSNVNIDENISAAHNNHDPLHHNDVHLSSNSINEPKSPQFSQSIIQIVNNIDEFTNKDNEQIKNVRIDCHFDDFETNHNLLSTRFYEQTDISSNLCNENVEDFYSQANIDLQQRSTYNNSNSVADNISNVNETGSININDSRAQERAARFIQASFRKKKVAHPDEMNEYKSATEEQVKSYVIDTEHTEEKAATFIQSIFRKKRMIKPQKGNLTDNKEVNVKHPNGINSRSEINASKFIQSYFRKKKMIKPHIVDITKYEKGNVNHKRTDVNDGTHPTETSTKLNQSPLNRWSIRKSSFDNITNNKEQNGQRGRAFNVYIDRYSNEKELEETKKYLKEDETAESDIDNIDHEKYLSNVLSEDLLGDRSEEDLLSMLQTVNDNRNEEHGTIESNLISNNKPINTVVKVDGILDESSYDKLPSNVLKEKSTKYIEIEDNRYEHDETKDYAGIQTKSDTDNQSLIDGFYGGVPLDSDENLLNTYDPELEDSVISNKSIVTQNYYLNDNNEHMDKCQTVMNITDSSFLVNNNVTKGTDQGELAIDEFKVVGNAYKTKVFPSIMNELLLKRKLTDAGASSKTVDAGESFASSTATTINDINNSSDVLSKATDIQQIADEKTEIDKKNDRGILPPSRGPIEDAFLLELKASLENLSNTRSKDKSKSIGEIARKMNLYPSTRGKQTHVPIENEIKVTNQVIASKNTDLGAYDANRNGSFLNKDDKLQYSNEGHQAEIDNLSGEIALNSSYKSHIITLYKESFSDSKDNDNVKVDVSPEGKSNHIAIDLPGDEMSRKQFKFRMLWRRLSGLTHSKYT